MKITAGLLAFLSLAKIAGPTVSDQGEAVATLCDFYDRWGQDTADGLWWPGWVTVSDLCTGRPSQRGPGRPSWCYGTPGIARALQLAAIATGDPARQETTENALVGSLKPSFLAMLADTGLCHGLAGTYQTATRAAADAITPAIGTRLPTLANMLTASAGASSGSLGLITGSPGTRLALETVRRSAPPISGWDSCLLLA